MVATTAIPVNPRDASTTERGAERMLSNPLPNTIDLFFIFFMFFMFLTRGGSNTAIRGSYPLSA